MDLMSTYYQVRMREEDINLQRASDNAYANIKLFRGLEDTKSFYDDSKKIEYHLEALRKTLDILRDNKLYVKLSKNGVRMDTDKVQTIKDWPVPRTHKEIHSFLGVSGY
ncbi:hypothetical protein PHMEG_00037573, partial [Phytophthora megakarya]